MTKLVLLRHGESQWNLENKFTGWVDVDLSNNKLTGDAPDFITSSNCKIVDLSNNELAGALPTVFPSALH